MDVIGFIMSGLFTFFLKMYKIAKKNYFAEVIITNSVSITCNKNCNVKELLRKLDLLTFKNLGLLLIT